MERRNLWVYVGYFGAIYLILLLTLVMGYPLAQQYAKPIVSIIFPLNPNASLGKMVLVVSGMYWTMVGIYIAINRKNAT